MNDLDKAWLAGIFDIGGNFRWKIQSGGIINSEMLYIGIGSTHEVTIEKIRELTEIKNKSSNQPKYPNSKRMFYFQVAGNKALKILNDIYPFLVTKKKIASDLLTIIENKGGALIKINLPNSTTIINT